MASGEERSVGRLIGESRHKGSEVLWMEEAKWGVKGEKSAGVRVWRRVVVLRVQVVVRTITLGGRRTRGQFRERERGM